MGKVYDSGGVYIVPTNIKPTAAGVTNWKIGTTITPDRRNDLINNYWKTLKRKFFFITDDEVLKLLQGGNGKIMLEVKNITDPNNVSIVWKANAPVNMNNIDDYFVIDSSYINGINPADTPDGILGSIGDFVTATIGFNNTKNTYHVILNRARTELVNNPGVLGPPPGSGVGFPPL